PLPILGTARAPRRRPREPGGGPRCPVPARHAGVGRIVDRSALERHGLPARVHAQVPPLREVLPALGARRVSPRASMTEGVAPVLRPFEAIGRRTIDMVEALGRFGSFFGIAVGLLFTPPFKLRAFLGRVHYIGFNSLLIILLTGTFTGMVLGLQLYFTL